MGSKLADIGATIDVGDSDLRELRRQRRRDMLTRIAQASAPIISVVLGVFAAEAMYPVRPHTYPYPYAPLMLASSTKTYYSRRPWTGPVLLSAALFIVTFAFVALFNTAANDNFGYSPRYTVFSRSNGAEE